MVSMDLREVGSKLCYGAAGGIAFVLVGWWMWIAVVAVQEAMKKHL